MDRHPVAFEDLARGLRALLFGSLVMVVGLLLQLHPAEALTLAILATMLVDLLQLVRTAPRCSSMPSAPGRSFPPGNPMVGSCCVARCFSPF
jgi:hypothetical protein